MRLVQAGVLTLLLGVFMVLSGCSNAILYAATALHNPQSAWYATQQLYAETQSAPALAPIASPVPTTLPTQGELPLATASPAPAAAPSIIPYTGELLGAIDLIPDTGMPGGTGGVTEQHYPNGVGNAYIPLSAGTLRNMTSVPNSTLSAELAKGMPFAIDPQSTEPQVLIMHTHATETYRLYQGLYYDLDSTARSTDKTKNVCAVGALMAQVLNEAGIVTLHDTTLNDYPSYNDSYDNSHQVVATYLAQYPSIKVVIDVHRDALGDETNWYAPICEIDGAQAAQVMLIAGCDNGSSITLPNCMENMRFAAAWHAEMEGTYPGLTRSAMFNYKYYNQDLTTGSLLLEVGGHGNNLNEALYAGQKAAESLAQMLLTAS